MMPSQHSRWVVVAALVSVLLMWRPADATEYAVGGEGINGWDTGTNYAAWAKAQSFAAGDVLVFEYVKSQHNVYEVTEAAYRYCDATAPGAVLATYDSGFDKIVLPEAKTYWFICNIPHHCTGGMKLAVTVSGTGAPGGSGISSLPPEASPGPPTPSSSAGVTGRSGWAAWAGLLVLVLVNGAS